MKKYVIDRVINCSTNTFTDSIKSQKSGFLRFNNSPQVYAIGRCLFLQYKTFGCHPLQRWLKLFCIKEDAGTKVLGYFIYPIWSCVLLGVFWITMIYQFYNLFAGIHQIQGNIKTIIISVVILAFFHGFIAFMFWTGKYSFRKEEREICEWVNSILESI